MAESFELQSRVPGSSNIQSQSSDQMIQVPENAEGQDSEIIWSGDCSICCKKLKHYQAFRKDGYTITVYTFAFIKGGEGTENIGYVEDLYEDYRRRKMVRVRWFNRSEEISSGVIIPEHEVVMTPDVQVVRAECVNGLATVLSRKHYEQCLGALSQDFSDGVYVCSRQLKNNKLRSFPLCKLRGYSNQTIFSILYPPITPNQQIPSSSSSKEEEKEEVQTCVVEKTQPTQQVLKMKPPVCVNVDGRFSVGEEIEVLCSDSGIRGCWFRCKILQASHKRFKVVYMDVEDAGGPGNLEEWVRAYRVAAPDKLGMRCLGRHTIRPSPTKSSCSNDDDAACFIVGAAVDAWWCDGWWEGVVVGTNIRTGNNNNNNTFRVYFPGENRFLNFEKKLLRSSKDWVDNKWVRVNPKPDIIVSLVSSSNSALGGCGPSGSGSTSVLASSAENEGHELAATNLHY